ncbi:protein zwilch [Vespula squamosa]|uniref:Protein zwilch n=1 Tax=Vespula squamosa TaxID=30214 RepID=A0ABD2A4V2_VESSQ
MSIIESLRNILSKDSSIIVNRARLSYIERLFPEFKDYIIIYKKGKKCFNRDVSDVESDDYDIEVTGNPLEYSFGDKFINSTLVIERYWYQEEELYIPLNRIEACTILNTCLKYLDNNNVIPIFILCDGKDHNKTAILGTIVQKNWLNTIEVTNNEMQALDTVKNDCSKLLSKHLKLSFSQPCNILVSTLSTYHLFGFSHKTLELPETEESCFEGSITLNIMANSILFDPPTRSSKNSFVLEIITGRNDSALVNLWHQLLLLNQYLMILDTYKEMNAKSYDKSNSLQYPNDFINPCAKDQDKIMKNVNLLLINDYSYRKSYYNKIEKIYIENDENNIKLKQYIEAACFRPNIDFTDLMWEVLMCIPNYTQMTECMHKIFQEILTGEYQPQLNVTNNTKFAKILPELSHQKTVTHLLLGCLPLETLIDIGFEKVSSDYKYILMNTGFITFDDIQKKFGKQPEKFDSNFYRKKLINMIQIHICLEFMLLLQKHINCPTDVLQSSLEYVLKEIASIEFSIEALKDLPKNKVYTLTIPAPNILINELNKGIPATWRVNLISESELSKTKTITYFSDMPIFPPNMYYTEHINKVNESFHVTTAVISSTVSTHT